MQEQRLARIPNSLSMQTEARVVSTALRWHSGLLSRALRGLRRLLPRTIWKGCGSFAISHQWAWRLPRASMDTICGRFAVCLKRVLSMSCRLMPHAAPGLQVFYVLAFFVKV